MKTKNLLATILFSALGLSAHAQEGVPATMGRDVIKMPSDSKNLSILDGKPYCSSANIMLNGTYRNEKLINFDAALDLVKVASRMDYVVRNPETGDLYYTALNKKGESYLYVYDTTGKKPVSKQIKLGKFQVYHPTFSSDGSILVFSSPNGLGFGGMDLWYSRLVDSEWEEPKNFGHKVNGPFDEVAPSMYGDYLIFSSNGRESSENDTVGGQRRLYVARLMSTRQMGDTVMRFPIGRAPIQMLPYPYNSSYESLEMTVDKASGVGYWLVSDNGSLQLFEMKGTLSGALAEGYVQDFSHKPIPGVKVTAFDAKGAMPLGASTTDVNGYYSIMLNPNADYVLSAEHVGYFSAQAQISTARGNQNPDIMITEHHANFELERMDMDKPYSLGDVFGPQADVDLCKEGEASLMKIVVYLRDNPELNAKWTVWSRFSNKQFSQMVTNQRIQTLKGYIESWGVKQNRLVFVNGDEKQSQPEVSGSGSCCEVVLSK